MKLYIRLAGVFLSILLLAGCGQDGGTGQSLAERIKKDMETLKPVSLSLISEDPENPLTVSYTHLDVYKRQRRGC